MSRDVINLTVVLFTLAIGATLRKTRLRTRPPAVIGHSDLYGVLVR
jgi:hypothetical protein